MRAIFGAVCLGLAAGPVMAECLSQSDLGRGVTVSYATGEVSVFRRVSSGLIFTDETYTDGSTTRFVLDRGIHVVEEYDLDDDLRPIANTGATYTYPLGMQSLPDITAGMRLETRVVQTWYDGYAYDMSLLVEAREGAPITVSGCTYDVIDTTVTFDLGTEDEFRVDYQFLPAIGISILAIVTSAGATPEFWNISSLERASK